MIEIHQEKTKFQYETETTSKHTTYAKHNKHSRNNKNPTPSIIGGQDFF